MQLGEDAGHVVLDGVLTDEQRMADLVVALAAREPLEDLQLALREGRPNGVRRVLARRDEANVPLPSPPTRKRSRLSGRVPPRGI